MFAKELAGRFSIPSDIAGHSSHPKLNLLVHKGMQRLLQDLGGGCLLCSLRKLLSWHCCSGLLPPAASSISSPPPSPSDFETLPIILVLYHPSHSERSLPVHMSSLGQAPSRSLWELLCGAKELWRRDNWLCARAVRKFLSGFS